MKTRLLHGVAALALMAVASAASAAEFDGSRPLICATVDAHACDPGETCLRGLPEFVGMPQFMRIDFAGQTIAGPKRTTPIRFIDKGLDQLILQGTELGYAWSIAIDKADGSMTVSLINREEAYVVFGNCTAP
ncbi:hypothetical protein [uncultured Caballeronia sp.]|jgi:hypothetical protein|uniref:hypothetical protein n=1 Tax=uncultured Caballeronia sp. TaxID=1827198 RepID=UPI0035CC4113